jgi:hypothetical protein
MKNIILLLVTILVVYTIVYNMKEHFGGMPTMLGSIKPSDKSAYINNSPADTAKVNTYNMPYQQPKLDGTTNLTPQITGKPAVIAHNNYSLLNDPLFSDVIYYENDMTTGRIGVDMCIEKCNGNCVEYGQTGNAYCFPKKN